MFQSATFKLTSWYLAIIITVSLLFSVIIYITASSEINNRIVNLKQGWPFNLYVDPTSFEALRQRQVHQAEANLVVSLTLANIVIWTIGGVGSYYLARRTLRPIEKAHEAQSRFTSDASHELRTPLASMKTELEVAMRDKTITKEEMRELLESNLEEVNKLAQLAHSLLQLSHLDHSAIEKKRVVLESTTKTVLKRFKQGGERVSISRVGKVEAAANPLHVEELLTILIDNALKYSPPDSEVTLHLFNQKQFAGFTVNNSGEGIAAADLPHIFDRFYTADTSRTSGAKKGYGLGLSLAKKIVELYEGELSVTSKPGGLTTFRLLLPKFGQSNTKA